MRSTLHAPSSICFVGWRTTSRDALIQEATATGIDRKTVEGVIDGDPALALVADLANLDEHGRLNKSPRSGHVPSISGATGTQSCDTWRLHLEVVHAGKHLDGLRVAQDAVDAWAPGLALASEPT